MEKQNTERGFSYYEFQDSSGDQCQIQKSSSAMEDKIWLGVSELDVKYMSKEGWLKYEFPKIDIVTNQRMHLNREQVAELLPILQKFVDTGEI